MRRHCHSDHGFTLIELLVVIGIIALLASLLLPALSRAKTSVQRGDCLGHLRQIGVAVHLYAGDHGDKFPAAANVTWDALETNHFFIFYKRLVKSYAGLSGVASPQDRLFTCPADRFHYDWPSLAYRTRGLHEQAATDFSSYAFNGAAETNPVPPAILNQASYGGLSGWKQAAVNAPASTVMLLEISAGFPWSWHQPASIPAGQCGFGDARNLLAFVDGHVSYLKVFRNPQFNLPSCNYEPPISYGYKWHAD